MVLQVAKNKSQASRGSPAGGRGGKGVEARSPAIG